MRYGSVCSGIEAATMAWHSLGWVPSFFSEIEAFPRAVLEHHYPEVPVHGDFTTIEADQYGSIDLLVGGTPCQSFSIAGLRKGLDDDRGNLALEFLRLAQRKQPKWVVWENVPGVLSSNGGRDFGSFLGALVELGYGFAYRVCDAQWWGVAQRRRRVFVVGYLGDWKRPAAVLFEREGLFGDSPPSREEGEKVAPAVTTGPPFSRTGNERVECEAIVPMQTVGALDTQCGLGQQAHQSLTSGHYVLERDVMGTLTTRTLTAMGARDVEEGALLTAVGFTASQTDMAIMHENCPTMISSTPHAVAFAQNSRNELRESDVVGALATGGGKPGQGYPAIRKNLSVRRLTPTECERLQGFPDGFTQIPYRNKPADQCPDGPRYKALGNSMAVPVMRWIGERIKTVEELW
jgi:DNA (cytosine-5)-methyltransferase 1